MQNIKTYIIVILTSILVGCSSSKEVEYTNKKSTAKKTASSLKIAPSKYMNVAVELKWVVIGNIKFVNTKFEFNLMI